MNDDMVEFLFRYFDTHCELNDEEEASVVRALAEENPQEAEEYVEFLTRQEKKGRAVGRLEGLAEGSRNVLMILIEKRFGAVPDTVRMGVAKVTDSPALNELTGAIIDADSMDDIELAVASAVEKATATEGLGEV